MKIEEQAKAYKVRRFSCICRINYNRFYRFSTFRSLFISPLCKQKRINFSSPKAIPNELAAVS
jgi:hypothetical protein